MKIHRKLTTLAGIGMLAVIAIAAFSFRSANETLSLSFRGIGATVLVVATATIFLVLFRLYLRRKVTAPLRELLKATDELGKGNFDYQVQVKGTKDIAVLARRFNEMARKVNLSYATELEQTLRDRTSELAALSAVALELSGAGSLQDMLDKSLSKIFETLPYLEARGGVFLCNATSESLKLIAQKGLCREFTANECSVRMGECLCGLVAQTGEVLYANDCDRTPPPQRRCSPEPAAHIAFPIKSRGIILGVVFLFPSKAFYLKPSDLQTFEIIGTQLGLAVENFGFYAEMKDSSAQYWDLYENARDILFTVDATGKLLSVNSAFEHFFGYAKLELIGKNILDFLTRQSVRAAVRVLADPDLPNVMELEVVRRDSGHAFVEVSVRRLFKGAATAGLQISARDITEQKALRELLVKAERLAAIGQVGVAVRHEINNPLTTVIGNIELLLDRIGGRDKDVDARLEIVLSNALRISDIIKRVEDLQQEKITEYLQGIKMTDLQKD
jgi:PAS domain S-box-containing protein